MPLVLLAQDDAEIAAATVASLRSLGCRTERVGSARDALHALRAEKPDLLILDVDLSGSDGLTFLQMFSLLPGLRTVPVISCRGRHPLSESSAAALNSVGVRHFLDHPLGIDSLAVALASAGTIHGQQLTLPPGSGPSPCEGHSLISRHGLSISVPTIDKSWTHQGLDSCAPQASSGLGTIDADLIVGEHWLDVSFVEVHEIIVVLRGPHEDIPVGAELQLSVSFRGEIGGKEQRFMASADCTLLNVEQGEQASRFTVQITECFPPAEFHRLLTHLQAQL